MIYTETRNGHVFTNENKHYETGRWRVIRRMDGKLLSHADWIRNLRIQRRLEAKSLTALGTLGTTD